jgi:O-acetyl-ADP-ribose deacetylase (regulator of RNase III)
VKLHLVDSDAEVAAELQRAFCRFTEVEVRHGDLLAIAEDCVVSPANSYGFMDGGFDKDLYAFFGPRIQSLVQDAVVRRPEGFLPVGASTIIHTGHHRIPYLIVAPTMTLPEQVESFNAYRAMRAVLRIQRAAKNALAHIFCPGLATGVGGVSPSDAAEQMARAYADFYEEA